jgi:UDP-N-acetylmuramoylalanine--D-glutamate ligase
MIVNDAHCGMRATAWRGKRVTVMGLGLHGGGLSVARWLLLQGANVCVTDLKTREGLKSSVRALERTAGRKGSGELQLVLGRHRLRDMRHADVLVQNPAVPRNSKYVQAARSARVVITNEAKLFLEHLQWAAPRVRVAAVTGTRGKSTTASMLHAMIEASGRRAFLAGNMRRAMFDHVDEIVQAASTQSVDVVLEFSSWHCEHFSARTVGPDLALVTNIMRDHLNRYSSMRSYVAAKTKLVRSCRGSVVLNWNDEQTRSMASVARGKLHWFSPKPWRGSRRVGCFVNEERWVVRDNQESIISTRHLQHLQGTHNVVNAAAAIAAARALHVPLRAIRAGLHAVRGLPGRMEILSRSGGMTVINDTCATTPDATIAALTSLSGDDIVLIAGGADKDLEYNEWAQVVSEGVRCLVLLPGAATMKMVAALQGSQSQVKIVHASTMQAAVREAYHQLQSKSVLLLSPGAASFGLFHHEFDRGDQFSKLVK